MSPLPHTAEHHPLRRFFLAGPWSSFALADGFENTGVDPVDPVLVESDLLLRQLPAASPWTLEQTLDPATLCAAAPSPQAAHVAMGV